MQSNDPVKSQRETNPIATAWTREFPELPITPLYLVPSHLGSYLLSIRQAAEEAQVLPPGLTESKLVDLSVPLTTSAYWLGLDFQMHQPPPRGELPDWLASSLIPTPAGPDLTNLDSTFHQLKQLFMHLAVAVSAKAGGREKDWQELLDHVDSIVSGAALNSYHIGRVDALACLTRVPPEILVAFSTTSAPEFVRALYRWEHVATEFLPSLLPTAIRPLLDLLDTVIHALPQQTRTTMTLDKTARLSRFPHLLQSSANIAFYLGFDHCMQGKALPITTARQLSRPAVEAIPPEDSPLLRDLGLPLVQAMDMLVELATTGPQRVARDSLPSDDTITIAFIHSFSSLYSSGVLAATLRQKNIPLASQD